ncbi:MAG TPA: MarR family transcriptional regulator [Ktedonobacterales bacterium]|nr:MarR family transcriptional regulator [Ktedonobacterales bacterium]
MQPPKPVNPMKPIEELRYLVLAAQREGNRFLAEALQSLALTPSQAEALRTLQEWQPLSLIELGSLLVCEQGSPSRLVAGLVAAGYVTRTPSSDDKRKVVLTLTPRGYELAQQVARVEEALYAALGALISDEQIETMLPALWAIVTGRPAGDALARRLRRLPLPSRTEEDETPG